MESFVELGDWFADPAHWSGANGIPTRIVEHLGISAVPVLLAVAVALPLGILIGHYRRGEVIVVSIANLGRAIPSFAILSIVFQVMASLVQAAAFGFWPTVVALFLLAVPPVITNTYVGIREVDQPTVEAARGMGMSERQVMVRLELPLAVPLMVAGIRTAAVQVVATATLAALIAGGGLGRYIVDGFAQGDTPKILAGAILVAILAVATEAVFAVLERLVTPRTSSRADGPPVSLGSPPPTVPETVTAA
ncbi:MAG TPA: ABC transporter permease [Candidatus Limnocylindrales bacterium]|jgi:osmoprotectant transport system permease protein